MRTLSIWKSISLFAILILGLSACNNDDDGTPVITPDIQNIVEIAQDNDGLNSLVAALSKADENGNSDLIGTLSGNGPFTVFAPTNEAFDNLFDDLEDYDSLDDFDTEDKKALLGEILKYHVVQGTGALSESLTEGQEITTLQGESVTISLEGGVFVQDATEGEAQVIQADVIAGNGVIHVINKVLIPKAVLDAINSATPEESKTLTEIVTETESLSLLEAAVIKADLAETLSSEGPFTVFAPTDDAFTELLEILGDDYNSLDDFDEEEEINLLRDILLYHVIPDSIPASALAEGTVATALTDNSIDFVASADGFVIVDASGEETNITATDIAASNGIAHTIDKVLLPQSALDFVASLDEDGTNGNNDIVATAQGVEDLSILVQALAQADAGLVEILQGEGPFTVFAPTNDAFQELLDLLGPDYESIEDFDTDDEKNILATVLTYHVVSGTAALSTDLTDGQTLETVQGESLTVRLADGAVEIDDATDFNATVTTADVESSNGVVHVIDRVLLPQEVIDLLNPFAQQ